VALSDRRQDLQGYITADYRALVEGDLIYGLEYADLAAGDREDELDHADDDDVSPDQNACVRQLEELPDAGTGAFHLLVASGLNLVTAMLPPAELFDVGFGAAAPLLVSNSPALMRLG